MQGPKGAQVTAGGTLQSERVLWDRTQLLSLLFSGEEKSSET